MNQATEILPLTATLPAPDRARDDTITSSWLLALITLVAAVLRLHAITAKSFWLDEAISVGIARLPWQQFFDVLRHREINMALYYVLLHFWLVLGSGEGFIRGLSVLFSVATVPVMYALGARLFGRGTGLLAAWLLAINAFHIRYAQEARGYALVVFFATVATWLFVRNLQEPYSTRWGAYAAACVLAVYSHLYAGLLIVAHCVTLTFLPQGNVPWRNILRSYFWFSCAMVPIGIVVAEVRTEPVSWIHPITPEALLHLAFDFSGNYGRPLLALDVFAIGLVALIASRTWRSPCRTMSGLGYALILAWLFVPIAVVLIPSLIRPLFVTRYLSPFFPALMLIVAVAIVRLRPAVLGWGLWTAISVCSILGTISYYHRDFDLTRQDWRTAASYVFDHAQPGDSIFFYQGAAEALFEFHRSQRHPPPVWPQCLNARNDSNGTNTEFVDIPGSGLQSTGPGGDRVWLVIVFFTDTQGKPDTAGAKVRDWFAKGRHRIDLQRLPSIDIVLFASDAAPLNRVSLNTQ